MVGSRLACESVDGRPHWFSPSTPSGIPETAHLLPNYDEYTIAYRERDAFLDRSEVAWPAARERSTFAHAIVVGGRIVGMWRRTLRRDAVVVETRFSAEPSAERRRAVAAAADRYGAFLGLPVVLS